jgi:opacity protein-like surface antigen
MKKILILAVLITILLPSSASADILLDGYHQVGICHKIINMDDFANYEFFTRNSMNNRLQFLQPDKCFSYYKFSTATINAIKKNNLAKLENKASGMSADELGKLMKNSRDFIKSDYKLAQVNNSVPDSNPLNRVEVQYKIIAIGSKLDIAKYKVIKNYRGGATEEEIFDIPQVNIWMGSLTNILGYWYFYIPILGIAGLIFVLIKRKKRLN